MAYSLSSKLPILPEVSHSDSLSEKGNKGKGKKGKGKKGSSKNSKKGDDAVKGDNSKNGKKRSPNTTTVMVGKSDKKLNKKLAKKARRKLLRAEEKANATSTTTAAASSTTNPPITNAGTLTVESESSDSDTTKKVSEFVQSSINGPTNYWTEVSSTKISQLCILYGCKVKESVIRKQ